MKKTVYITLGAALAGSAFAQTALTNANYSSQITDVTADATYNITADITLLADQEYVLEGPTFVTNDATITIQEGAIVRGQPTASGKEPGMLVITRDGKINAEGTASNPIIFTTAATDASNTRWTSGDSFLDATPKTAPIALSANRWGALCLLGKAPTNTANIDTTKPGEAYIEGITQDNRSVYGGQDANDNSGVVKYVSIRYSGEVITDGDEIQGLTLGGVGFGTTLEYIEVYGSGDDGIEIFGGTCGVKNLVLYGHDDDGFDGDHGWNGYAQNVLIINTPSTAGYNSNHAIELDGDDTGDFDGDEDNVSDDGRPFASGHLANFTVIGVGNSNSEGCRFRRGFGGSFKNSIVAGPFGSSKEGLRIDNDGGVLNDGTNLPVDAGYGSIKCEDRVTAGTFNIAGNTFAGFTAASAGDGDDSVEDDVIANTAKGASDNNVNDPQFGQVGTGIFAKDQGGIDASDIAAGTFNPVPSPNASLGNTVDVGNNFFNVQDYRGAFQPNASLELWTTGWTAIHSAGIIIDRQAEDSE